MPTSAPGFFFSTGRILIVFCKAIAAPSLGARVTGVKLPVPHEAACPAKLAAASTRGRGRGRAKRAQKKAATEGATPGGTSGTAPGQARKNGHPQGDNQG